MIQYRQNIIDLTSSNLDSNQQKTFSGGKGSIHSTTALRLDAAPGEGEIRPLAKAKSSRLSPARADKQLGPDFSTDKDLSLLRSKYEDLKKQLDTEEEEMRNSFRSSGYEKILSQHITGRQP